MKITENPNEKIPEIYRKLRSKMEGIGVGIGPETSDGAGYKFLMTIFTEEEADLYVKLSYQWETAADFAKRNNMDPEEAEKKLYAASKRRGAIYRKKMPNGTYMYQPAARGIGVWEWAVPIMEHEWVSDFFDEGGQEPNYVYHADNPYPLFRTMPISKDVLAEGETLMEYDDIERYVRNASCRNVWTCACTEAMRKGGMPAADGSGYIPYDEVENYHPLETCLALNDMAEFYTENGWGHELTVDECLAHVRDMLDNYGFIANVYNSKKAECICFCNPKVCMFLGTRFAEPNQRFLNNYIVRRDNSKCTNCGNCFDACHLHLIKLDDNGRAATDLSYCTGCGQCVRKCPNEAIKIYQKEDGWMIPPDDMTMNQDLQVLWGNRTRKLDPLAPNLSEAFDQYAGTNVAK